MTFPTSNMTGARTLSLRGLNEGAGLEPFDPMAVSKLDHSREMAAIERHFAGESSPSPACEVAV